MSEHLRWDALSLNTKLDIILSEALRSHGSESGLEFVTARLCNNQKLIEALEKRGRIWDKNKQETSVLIFIYENGNLFTFTCSESDGPSL